MEQNTKNKFTRMCIGEAVIELLKTSDLPHLKILEIARRAGVSRMTFYKYYHSAQDALVDYLHIIIQEYIETMEDDDRQVFLSYEHILFSLNFFDRYRSFFLTMNAQGLYSILIDSVNQFVTENMPTTRSISMYKKYSYAGSLLNCFLIWEERDKIDSVEDVARNIYELYGEYSR